ncbi:MAG: translation initiation factor IF-2 [Flavobacteriales bacterium]
MRLSKVAKELNVSIDRLVEKLASKGFEVEARPNTKLTAEQYDCLNEAFQSDHSQKLKSKAVSQKKAKEKEALIAERQAKEAEAEQKEALEKEAKAKEELAQAEAAAAEKAQAEAAEKARQAEAEKAKAKAEAAKSANVTKAKATVKGVKTVGLVDLDNLKKPSKSKKAAPTSAKKTEKAKEEAPKAKVESTPETPKQNVEVVKAKGQTLKGVKSVGKIDVKAKANQEKFNTVGTKDKAKLKEELAKKLTSAQAEKQPEVEAPKETKPAEAPPVEVIKAKSKTLSGPTFTGQKVDLSKFKKPVKKVASSNASSAAKKKEADKKKRKRINKTGPGGKNQQGRNQANRNNNNRRRGEKPVAKAEPTEAEIQKKIKDTLNRLTSSSKTKGSKYKKSKRDERKGEEIKAQKQQEQEQKHIKVTEFVTVHELAVMMDVSITEVISSCMMLGLMVTMNQRLDADTLQIVAEEFGFNVEFVSADMQEAIDEEQEEENDADAIERPPIVTVMGHVDHGKTSLLDYIRNANVIAGEAGGITQHIGSYSVELPNGKPMTFIDTPGHEAFTAMRARGAKVTDVVIIVISAEDRIMPQTKEAIAHAQAADVPIIFAINKVDKPNANPEKIKEELAGQNLLVESWGGKYQSYDVSAKTGLNVDALLEGVLLEAELLELKANPDRAAKGSILEASLDKGKGYTTNILVQTGTLTVGDFILTGQYYGKVKAMHDERGNEIEKAGPSHPVSILGLNGAPQAGDTFHVMNDEREAKSIATRRTQLQREQSVRTTKQLTLEEIGRRLAVGDFQELNIIIKGDVDGSLEALSDSLQKLSTESIQINILHKGVGQISESDVLLATASNAIIIGFQVRPSGSARKVAEQEDIDIRLYSIIYDAINDVKEAMEGMLAPTFKEEIVANLVIRNTFKISKIGTIAGCYVTSGKISRNSDVRVIRDGVVIHTGALGSLKRFKDDVKEVNKGYECGLNLAKFNDLKEEDIIEAYEMVEVKQKLK